MSPGSWWIINLRNSPLIIVKNLVFLTLRRSLFQSNRNICRVGRISVDRTVLCKYIYSLQISGNVWILLFTFLFQINVWIRFRKYYTYVHKYNCRLIFSSISSITSTCNQRINSTYLYFFTAIQIRRKNLSLPLCITNVLMIDRLHCEKSNYRPTQ